MKTLFEDLRGPTLWLLVLLLACHGAKADPLRYDLIGDGSDPFDLSFTLEAPLSSYRAGAVPLSDVTLILDERTTAYGDALGSYALYDVGAGLPGQLLYFNPKNDGAAFAWALDPREVASQVTLLSAADPMYLGFGGGSERPYWRTEAPETVLDVRTVRVTSVPEPGTLVLWALGLAALVWLRNFRKTH